MELECVFSNECRSNGIKYLCTVKSIKLSTIPNARIKLVHGKHLPGKTNDDVEGLEIHNQIVQHIPKGIPQLFPKLTNLTLWYCGLKEVSESDFVGLEKLEVLEISDNPLRLLPDDLFTNMKSLRWIYCQNNQIETLSSKIIDPIKDNDLQVVDFTNNLKLNARFRVKTADTLENLMKEIDETCTPSTPPRTHAAEWIQEIPENMKRNLISRKFSDFSIKIKDKEFQVHKLVLASQSSVFEKMFSDDTEEGAKIFKDVEDFSVEAFEDFIDYLYTGIIRNKCVTVQLFVLASLFKVSQLKTMCEETILENLNEDNAQEIYNLGFTYSINLKQGAFAVLQKMIPGLMPHSIEDSELMTEIIENKNQLESSLQKQAKVKVEQ